MNADIIIAAPIVGKRDQFFRRGKQVRAVAAKRGHFRGFHRAVQTVRAQQENVPGEYLMIVGLHIHNQLGSERTAEDVPRQTFPGLLRRNQTEAHLLAGESVIARDLGCVAISNQITSRISYVSHRYLVEPQGASYDRRGHARGTLSAGRRGFENVCVGLLHQPGKESGVRFPILGLPESGNHAFDSRARCDFALLIAAHSIRQHKQPPLRTRLSGSLRRRMTKIIFIMVADSSDVGSFYEL